MRVKFLNRTPKLLRPGVRAAAYLGLGFLNCTPKAATPFRVRVSVRILNPPLFIVNSFIFAYLLSLLALSTECVEGLQSFPRITTRRRSQ